MLVENINTDELIGRGKNYLEKTLSIVVDYQSWKEKGRLPLYLRELYDFYSIKVLSNTFLMLVYREEKEQTPAIVRKHIDQIRAKYQGDIVYTCSIMTSYNRVRFIEQVISFIVPDNQMFLPFLGLDLREYYKGAKQKTEKFSPSAQAVVLFFLIQKEYENIHPNLISKQLHYSLMTIHRALNQLEGIGAIKLIDQGRKSRYQFVYQGKQLWDFILPFLESPILRKVVLPTQFSKYLPIQADLSALSHYSMLGEPQRKVLATNSPQILKEIEGYRELPENEWDAIEIEIWKYDPILLSKDGLVDKLSLFLSLRDNPDERIVASLKEMMGDIWYMA